MATTVMERVLNELDAVTALNRVVIGKGRSVATRLDEKQAIREMTRAEREEYGAASRKTQRRLLVLEHKIAAVSRMMKRRRRSDLPRLLTTLKLCRASAELMNAALDAEMEMLGIAQKKLGQRK